MSEKVSPGELIEPAAKTWNEMVDAKDDYLRRKATAVGNASSYPAGVKVKNNTGGALRKGSVVAFAGYPLGNQYLSQDYLWLNGTVPTANSNGFGIVTQAIAGGAFGPCLTTGTCMAVVNVTNTSHKFANLSNGTTLQSAESGPVRIDYAPGTGVVDCIVTIAPSVSSSELVVFELTSVLTPLGQASAKLCSLMGLGGIWFPTAQTITVKDSNGLWSGLPPYQGLAFRREDGKYEIVFMQRKDLIVEFTVFADRDPGFGFLQGTLNYSFQHGNRQPPLLDGVISVHDPAFMFKYALKGGHGYAIYNDELDRYEVIACEQRCFLARARVNDTGGFGDIVDVTIDDFRAASPSPFDLVPETLPTKVFNRFGHRGRDNDVLLLAWDEVTNDWIIIDVQKKTQPVTIGLRLNAAKTKIQAKEIDCALEYQDDPDDAARWVDKFDVGTC